MTRRAANDPARLEFVLSPDTSEIEIRRRVDYDLHVRAEPAPLIVFVHGPVRGAAERPRLWPVYRGYAALAAIAGAAAVIADLDYTDVQALNGPTAELERVIAAARSENGVDSERVALWAFSGGARLVGRWLEEPPAWLKVVALTYPAAPSVARVGVPLVITRVGREHPRLQATVDRLLAVAPTARIIDVPDGQHGFDMLDHNAESREAVTRAVNAVTALLHD